ncbi:MAG: hypothetical protein ACI3XJ_06255 [Oscillospiraceae bacterium]
MTAQKKPRRKRRSYLNDFQQTVTGEYVYTGKTYAFCGSPQERKKLLRRLIFLGCFMLAESVASGCIGVPGMLNCFYVILPYSAAFLSEVSLVWGLVRLIRGGEPLRQYIYNASVKAFPARTVCTMVFSLLAVLCEIIYVLLHGTQGLTAGFLLFVFFHILIFAAAFLWRRLIRCSEWTGDGTSH